MGQQGAPNWTDGDARRHLQVCSSILASRDLLHLTHPYALRGWGWGRGTWSLELQTETEQTPSPKGAASPPCTEGLKENETGVKQGGATCWRPRSVGD